MKEDKLFHFIKNLIFSAIFKYSPQNYPMNELFKKNRIEKENIRRALFLGKCAIPFYKAFKNFKLEIPAFVYSPFQVTRLKQETAIIRFGTHPFPSETNFEVCKELEKWLNDGEGDIAVFLSGGASSLLSYPEDDYTIRDLINIEKMLLLKGIPIEKMNIVRMAISKMRGGGLLKLLKGFNVYCFIWCDVSPSKYKFVGSAPFGGIKIDLLKELMKIEKEYGIRIKMIEKKVETLNKPSFIKKLLDGEKLALLIKNEIKKSGFYCEKIKIEEGKTSIEASKIISDLINTKKRPMVFIGNGEFTVEVKGNGKGGRASHLTALILKNLYGQKGWFFGALATDGLDGNGDGGAYAHYLQNIDLKKLDEAIENFNTATFFRENKSFFGRKPTGNNLRDLWFLILK